MNLKHFTGIKLFPSEQILDVQREHWLIVAIPISLSLGFIVTILVSLSFVTTKVDLGKDILALVTLLTVAVTSFFINLAVYAFMQWFYQFYIITNKRIAHIHYFRFGGFHLDEVFHQQVNPLEIDKNPPNFFFDFLGIEDIYVYFKKMDRPEPFIFKVPQNAEVIAELLESYTLQKD